MEYFQIIDKLTGGLRHLQTRDAEEVEKYSVPVETVPRPGFNNTGKEIEVAVNAYPINEYPNRTIYQYDVNIGNGQEKDIVCKKVWNSEARKSRIKQVIFDGRKLAWSLNDYTKDINILVDLDAEQGRPAGRKPNVFRLVVRRTTKVNLAVLNSWLKGRSSIDQSVIEALNFLDHLLREWPSTRFLALRRSFFDEDEDGYDVGNGVIAIKGMYQAIRPAINRGLVINVDVSNTCFWARISFLGAALAVLDARDHQDVIHQLRPAADGHGGVTHSRGFEEVHKRTRKLVVQAHYQGCPCAGVNFTVKGLINANARQYIIDLKDRATGVVERITVEEYFRRKYNIRLTYWELPMVEMTKKSVVYPMEFLTIHGLHKYPWKLNEYQTSSMIKYAASRPTERLDSIRKSKQLLAHSQDPVLKSFGLQVGENMIHTKARLLPAPELLFGANQRHNPGTNGRWDLRNKKFYKPNKNDLVGWGVGFIPGKRNVINKTHVEKFVDGFMKTYAGHGGKVTRRPIIVELKEDTGEAIKRLYNATGNQFQMDPQLLLIIVPDKNAFTYMRIKKSCDCRWGVPSQVLQSAHVVKGNPQYISNVLMKVNAKLGGTTARAVPRTPKTALRPKSMIIGADLTHPTLGVWQPTMAAMSVCMDDFGGRYWGSCECNGDRNEIIARANLEHMLLPLVREWMSTVGEGRAPENVYYFRDGVSTGEFAKILNSEVLDMRSIFMQLTQDRWQGKITVVVANKRHHIRAFPRPGDRNAADKNSNPLPGTLIEKDITSPHDWDFFLYSHIALQGTARPVHYHVILDQIGHKPHELENMIYDHCYQYIRSTTSVSLFPAIYYAHLIAARARHHEDVPASSGLRSGAPIPLTNPKPKDRPVDPRLMPIHGTSNKLPFGVWYI
ncbi:Piwi domain-containing protein [Aspergillus avenaceus]|uniref:Piwi domain-containing protein n=1 Tax=Aspergillus avenaceus TaxID=36643 RepID=A0A5N6U252_ASPAV|nr:Piwi domain-containing protein [Aspergillus avenaceus]